MSYRSIIIGHITNDINTDCEGNTERADDHTQLE